MIRNAAFPSAVSLFALSAAFASFAPAAAFAQESVQEAEARVDDPFFRRDSFSIARTLYVATDEPGASNTNNGKYPTFRGGKNGPFKNFNASVLRQAMTSSSTGLLVLVRHGAYSVPDGGLKLRGGGTEATPVILAGYPGDARAVIDGGECLTAAKLASIAAGQPYVPRVEVLLKIDGQYAIVQDLQLQCGFRHNVLVRGDHVITRRNVLRAAYEDSIKTIGGADFGLIADNDIAGFSSQAVDNVASNHWMITGNQIHDPAPNPMTGGHDGNAITVKGSARNVIITRNLVHTFLTTPGQSAFTLGAPSHLDSLQYDLSGNVLPAAIDVVAMGNRVEGFTGAAFAVQSCADCVVAENVVDRTLGLFRLGIAEEVRQADPDSGVLPYSVGTVVRSNRMLFRSIDCAEPVYIGQSCYAGFIANGLEAAGLELFDNAYFADASPWFATEWGLFDFEFFQTSLGTETNSLLLPVALWP